MTSAIAIRKVNTADFDEWSRMRTLLWPDTPYSHRSEIELYFAGKSHNPSLVFVVENPPGGLCGFLELSIRNYAEGTISAAVPFIEGWYVDVAFQGQGIGRLLMTAAESWAIENGYSELGSDAEIDNERSIAAHKQLGFEETSRCVTFLKQLQ